MKRRTDKYRKEWMYEDYKTERMSSCGGNDYRNDTTRKRSEATNERERNE